MGSLPPSYRVGFNLSNQHQRIATIPQQNSTASRFQFLNGVDVPTPRVRVLPNSTSTLQFQEGVAVVDEVSASRIRVLPTTTITTQAQEDVTMMRLRPLLISACMRSRVHHKSATSSCFNDSGANLEKENDTCIICQAEYKKLEKIGILDCGHEYHVECVKQWLLINKTCPICRRAAVP
ncbi:hypothetical protein MKW98_023967 [Papaver atlanticum]|uniref:RING-type E3 ubiquitin transferase n=1 Tax=Papaver atlanticum TaxID=357466 RepID=A0AAD4T067_9MAGN|nr:hypothetical protein MKW98_023967 [Papaver atlanticum]